MDKLIKKYLSIIGLASLAITAQAQYSADVAAGDVFGNPLYSNPSTLAPTNTIVWFVASVDSSLGTFGLNTTITPDQLLGPDDTLLVQTKLDGAGGAFGPGILFETYDNIPAVNGTRNIFLILFGNRTAPGLVNHTPGDGDQFGFAALGVRPPPQFGNADWSPLSSVIGNTHLIVIPEPSTYLLGGLGLLGLLGYRRFRK
jgi:hypothetical protein